MTIITYGAAMPLARAAFARVKIFFLLLRDAFVEAQTMSVERDLARHRQFHNISSKDDGSSPTVG